MSYKTRLGVCLRIGLVATVMGVCAMPGGARAARPAEATFASPDKAAQTLVEALRTSDHRELLKIFGKQNEGLLSSGDAVADHNATQRFLQSYDQMHRFRYGDADQLYLLVGADNWPMPIPLRHSSSGWYFDTAAGAKELLYRRVGANENNAILVCRTIVAAQHVYAAQPHDGHAAGEYARKFLSDPGKQNGLFWPVKEGEPESPIGPLVAQAAEQGYLPGQHKGTPSPYHGYYFRILLQSPQASSDSANADFLILAYPAKYESSGIMTFVATSDGAVYQKDLGPQVPPAKASFMSYRPNSTWQLVEPAPGAEPDAPEPAN